MIEANAGSIIFEDRALPIELNPQQEAGLRAEIVAELEKINKKGFSKLRFSSEQMNGIASRLLYIITKPSDEGEIINELSARYPRLEFFFREKIQEMRGFRTDNIRPPTASA